MVAESSPGRQKVVPGKNKVFNSFAEAVADIHDSASVLMMSFGGPAGVAQNLILALRDRGVKNLTAYSCPNMGFVGGIRQKPGFKPYVTPAVLVENHQVKKAVVSWAKGDAEFLNVLEQALRQGEEVEVEFLPLLVYATKIMAGGFRMAGFYSPIGAGTPYSKNRESRVFDDKEYLLEPSIRAQFGFVRAYKADDKGNLIYRGTMRGANSLIAQASEITIAEVDEIVERGELDPEQIITPGIFVDRIVKIPEGGWK